MTLKTKLILAAMAVAVGAVLVMLAAKSCSKHLVALKTSQIIESILKTQIETSDKALEALNSKIDKEISEIRDIDSQISTLNGSLLLIESESNSAIKKYCDMTDAEIDAAIKNMLKK